MDEQFLESLKKTSVIDLFEMVKRRSHRGLKLDNESIDSVFAELETRNLATEEVAEFNKIKLVYKKAEPQGEALGAGNYPALVTIIGFISFLGYLVMVVGVLVFLYFVTEAALLPGVIGILVSLIIGLSLLALSNLIRVFLDTEYNTRKTREALTTIINSGRKTLS